MPGYVQKMLQRFRPQYLLPGHRHPRTPGIYIAPSFSKQPPKVFVDKSAKLSPTLVTELQAIIGTLLYYARAVDPTLLPIANDLMSWHHNRPTPHDEFSTQPIAPSATVRHTKTTGSSITLATWCSTRSPMLLTYADHTPAQ